MPKYDEIMFPLLDYIKGGNEYNVREISDSIADKYFNLSEEQKRELASNGHLRFLDRLLWARTYLKKAGLVEDPRRGFVKITKLGVDFLNTKNEVKKITDNDLLQFENFNDFINISRETIRQDKININEDVTSSKNTPQENIEYGFNEINKSLQFDLLQKLKGMNPYYFEKVILLLFQKMGYGDFEETSKSRDGGIDGIINQDQLGIDRIYTQTKRYTDNNVGEKEITNFIGAMSRDVNKGIFVTTSKFSQSAIEKAKNASHKIILIDGERLTRLMIDYNIGVQTVQEFRLKEVDDDFFVE